MKQDLGLMAHAGPLGGKAFLRIIQFPTIINRRSTKTTPRQSLPVSAPLEFNTGTVSFPNSFLNISTKSANSAYIPSSSIMIDSFSIPPPTKLCRGLVASSPIPGMRSMPSSESAVKNRSIESILFDVSILSIFVWVASVVSSVRQLLCAFLLCEKNLCVCFVSARLLIVCVSLFLCDQPFVGRNAPVDVAN
jgi:hypothetical protein